MTDTASEIPAKKKYSLPEPVRHRENLHIIFWLIKDISWCMLWRPVGMLMIIPTMIVAVNICIKTRKNSSELYHNIAVVLWIIANSYWMTSEFYHFDESFFMYGIIYKELAIVPFGIGVMILIYYYLIIRPRRKQ